MWWRKRSTANGVRDGIYSIIVLKKSIHLQKKCNVFAIALFQEQKKTNGITHKSMRSKKKTVKKPKTLASKLTKSVTKSAVRRMARRGGVKRISGLMYAEAQNVIRSFVTDLVRDTVTYTEYAKRKTVSALDVIHALRRRGQNLYGYNDDGVVQRPKRKKSAATTSSGPGPATVAPEAQASSFVVPSTPLERKVTRLPLVPVPEGPEGEPELFGEGIEAPPRPLAKQFREEEEVPRRKIQKKGNLAEWLNGKGSRTHPIEVSSQ